MTMIEKVASALLLALLLANCAGSCVDHPKFENPWVISTHDSCPKP
jgi:PBP1b-binding outer membrane lipoprotein LpoB